MLTAVTACDIRLRHVRSSAYAFNVQCMLSAWSLLCIQR